MNVILLHGLAGSKFSMVRIERALLKAGFNPLNISYPSTRQPLENLAAGVFEKIRGKLPEFQQSVDFVSYSMGGILVRLIARDHPGLVHRAVMIAPPNRGSFWAARFADKPMLGRWIGPAGRQLGTGQEELPCCLGAVDFPLGVIAGVRSDNPLAPLVTDEPGDGRVSVAQTCVEGMKAHCTFPYGHLELPFRQPVIRNVVQFLSDEEFPG